MKQLIALILALVILLSLCACGAADEEKGAGESIKESSSEITIDIPKTSADTPSKNQIQEDVVQALQNKNQYATLRSLETVKSLTGEGSYQITLHLTAETTYADCEYEAELLYTKYDQGWMIDNVSWGSSSYHVVRFPDDPNMMLERANTEYISENSTIAGRITRDGATITDVIIEAENVTESGNIFVTFVANEHLRHAEKIHNYTTQWNYMLDSDSWECDKDYYFSSSTETIPNNVDFSGSWLIQAGRIGEYMTISNFSFDSFDVDYGQGFSTFRRTTSVNGYEAPGVSLYYQNEDDIFCCIMFNKDCTSIGISRANSVAMAVILIYDECRK